MTAARQGCVDRERLVIVLVALAGGIGIAFGLQHATVGGAGAPKGAPAPPYSVTVANDGAAQRTFTVEDLERLPAVNVTIDGKLQHGPRLTTVLAAAGTPGDVAMVSIVGMGLRDNGHLTVRGAALIRSLMLDFSERGTVKVCSPKLDRAQWVRDVTRIEVD